MCELEAVNGLETQAQLVRPLSEPLFGGARGWVAGGFRGDWEEGEGDCQLVLG